MENRSVFRLSTCIRVFVLMVCTLALEFQQGPCCHPGNLRELHGRRGCEVTYCTSPCGPGLRRTARTGPQVRHMGRLRWRGRPNRVTWTDAGLAVVAFIGVTGFIPATVVPLAVGVGGLAQKIAEIVASWIARK